MYPFTDRRETCTSENTGAAHKINLQSLFCESVPEPDNSWFV